MSIGFHVGRNAKLKDLTKSIEQVVSEIKNMECVQIFTHGPRSKAETKMDKKTLGELKTRIYVHATYLTYLSKENEKHILDQLNVCKQINACGLVIHLPKRAPSYIAENVDILVKHKPKTKIILEMTAVIPDSTSYESPEKLLNLIKLLEDRGITSEQVGFCIDTSHIYAGKMEIRSYADAKKYISKLEHKANWFQLLHLNGNKYDNTKCSKDHHAVPFSSEDMIWGKIPFDKSGCLAFVEWYKNKDIILECHEIDTEARKMHKLLTGVH